MPFMLIKKPKLPDWRIEVVLSCYGKAIWKVERTDGLPVNTKVIGKLIINFIEKEKENAV